MGLKGPIVCPALTRIVTGCWARAGIAAKSASRIRRMVLKVEFQGKLYVPRSADRRRDHAAASSTIDIGTGGGETRSIGHVESFRPKLQTGSLADLELLEQREIEILEAVFAQEIRA